jgi:hypothetical protein
MENHLKHHNFFAANRYTVSTSRFMPMPSRASLRFDLATFPVAPGSIAWRL